MIASHVTESDLQTAAAAVHVRLENVRRQGKRVAFVLRLDDSKSYQRRSPSGRRVAAVCWHGHRDFFKALFAVNPAAEIRSSWTHGRVHYTAANFETTYPGTGHANIGSMFNRCEYQDACDCR